MLGHETEFGYIHAVKLAQSSSILEKRGRVFDVVDRGRGRRLRTERVAAAAHDVDRHAQA